MPGSLLHRCRYCGAAITSHQAAREVVARKTGGGAMIVYRCRARGACARRAKEKPDA